MRLTRLLQLSFISLVVAAVFGRHARADPAPAAQQLVTGTAPAAFTIAAQSSTENDRSGMRVVLAIHAYHPVGRGGAIVVTQVSGETRQVVANFSMYPDAPFEEGPGQPPHRYAIAPLLSSDADGLLRFEVSLTTAPADEATRARVAMSIAAAP